MRSRKVATARHCRRGPCVYRAIRDGWPCPVIREKSQSRAQNDSLSLSPAHDSTSLYLHFRALGRLLLLGGLFLAPSIHAAANEICPNHPRRWGETLIKVIYCFHQNNDASKCEVGHTSFPIRPSKSPADWILGPVLVPGYWSQEGIHGTETS